MELASLSKSLPEWPFHRICDLKAPVEVAAKSCQKVHMKQMQACWIVQLECR